VLTTLVLHQEDPHIVTTLNFRAIVGTLRQLPNLRELSISGLPESSFTNLTLNALPPTLKLLRLENLPGVDDKGLRRFTSSHLMTSIENLLLIDVEILDLTSISNILSAHSANLKAFSLAQDRAPGLPTRNSTPATFHSPTLRYIHWEIRSDAGPFPTLPFASNSPITPEELSFPFTNKEPISSFATSLLATSIKNGAFTSLRRIRIPHDPQGLVQELCKPLAIALLPCDMASPSFVMSLPKKMADNPERNTAADPAFSPPIMTTDFTQAMPTPTLSRLAAQARIMAARKNTLMTVRVYDPNNKIKDNRMIRDFIGQVDSRITYDLRADRRRLYAAVTDDGEEQNEWITNITTVVMNRVRERGVAVDIGSKPRPSWCRNCFNALRGKAQFVHALRKHSIYLSRYSCTRPCSFSNHSQRSHNVSLHFSEDIANSAIVKYLMYLD
jgi:hypothetical protein